MIKGLMEYLHWWLMWQRIYYHVHFSWKICMLAVKHSLQMSSFSWYVYYARICKPDTELSVYFLGDCESQNTNMMLNFACHCKHGQCDGAVWHHLSLGEASITVVRQHWTKQPCQLAPYAAQGCSFHHTTKPITVSAATAVIPACCLSVQSRQWGGEPADTETIRYVYAPERAQVAEGQDSKWPDESVILGKFHPSNSVGSKMWAGKFILMGLTWRDNAPAGWEIGERRVDCKCSES